MAASHLRTVFRRKAGSDDDDDDDDRISQLPDDVKDRILQCLDTRTAARTALLSTQWEDAWLRHGRLHFDWDFSKAKVGAKRTRGGNKRAVFVKMVNDILFFRSGPVKKFKLIITHFSLKLLQSDLDVWCRYLSRNGIENLHLSCPTIDQDGGSLRYELPVCIYSCQTIKRLRLNGFKFDCMANARRLRSVFSGITYLVLKNCLVSMHQYANGTVPTLPNLEELFFIHCDEIKDFVISAPKLHTLGLRCLPIHIDSKWFESHFQTIKTLHLSANYILRTHAGGAVRSFPATIKLRVLNLFAFSFAKDEVLATSIQLLKKCPSLCVLKIVLGVKSEDTYVTQTAPRILEDPSRWFNNQDLCKLKTVMIESFRGSRQEMLFVKAILSNSPTLEKLVIKESASLDASVAFKFPRELLCVPRASQKVQIVFKDTKCTNTGLVR